MTICLIAANPSVATTTGWPVGYWASELTHPYDHFVHAGYNCVIASPAGGTIVVDAMSDPSDASGYSKDDNISARYLADPDFRKRCAETLPVASLDAADFEAVVVVGGQSPMFTFAQSQGLQDFFLAAYRTGVLCAALCHGTCLLLSLRQEDGRPFLAGRTITGFTNAEEDYVDQAVGTKVMPFRIEDEATAQGARFRSAAPFEPHVVQDEHLITGQQQNSGTAVAEAVVAALKASRSHA
jgi:putative intracellular protease/amidase